MTHPERGGTFNLSSDQTSPANNATRFKRSNGTYVDRQWDNQNFTLDWVAETELQPHLGLEKAIKLWNGSKRIVGIPGKEYIFTRETSITNYGAWLDGISFRRGTPPATELTAAAPNGAQVITVASTAGFQVGDRVGIATSPHYLDSINYAYTPQIVSLTPTTIIVSGFFNRVSGTADWPVGAVVFRVNRILRIVTDKPVTITNCIIDGNYQDNYYTLSWVTNTAIVLKSPQGLIEDCLFYDSPCETCMVQGTVRVTNNIAYQLQGSFVHMSQGFGTPGETITVDFNTVDGVCLAGNASQHAEGCVTWSSNVPDVVIANNDFRNGVLGCFSNLSSDDGNLWVLSNYCENFGSIMLAYGGQVVFGTTISYAGNQFHDCGLLEIKGTNATKGWTYLSWEILSSVFTGTSRLKATQVENFLLADCSFENMVEFGNNFRNGTIRNVSIAGTGAVGMKLNYVSSSKSRSIYWSQNVAVEDVTISGFSNGLVCQGILTATNNTVTSGWTMDRIAVTSPASCPGAIGLETPPGATCSELLVNCNDPGMYTALLGGADNGYTA